MKSLILTKPARSDLITSLASHVCQEHAASSWASLSATVNHCSQMPAVINGAEAFNAAAAAVDNGGAIRNWALVQCAVFWEQAARARGEGWAQLHFCEAALLGVDRALLDALRDPRLQGQPWVPATASEKAQYKAVLEWRLQSRACARAMLDRTGSYVEEDVARHRRILFDEEPPRLVSILDSARFGNGKARPTQQTARSSGDNGSKKKGSSKGKKGRGKKS